MNEFLTPESQSVVASGILGASWAVAGEGFQPSQLKSEYEAIGVRVDIQTPRISLFFRKP